MRWIGHSEPMEEGNASNTCFLTAKSRILSIVGIPVRLRKIRLVSVVTTPRPVPADPSRVVVAPLGEVWACLSAVALRCRLIARYDLGEDLSVPDLFRWVLIGYSKQSKHHSRATALYLLSIHLALRDCFRPGSRNVQGH